MVDLVLETKVVETKVVEPHLEVVKTRPRAMIKPMEKLVPSPTEVVNAAPPSTAFAMVVPAAVTAEQLLPHVHRLPLNSLVQKELLLLLRTQIVLLKSAMTQTLHQQLLRVV